MRNSSFCHFGDVLGRNDRMDEKQTVSPIRVLLWSPQGSGEHYNGPASFTYRLYSSAPEGRVALTLAHGLPSQEMYELFKSQHCVSELGGSPLQIHRFIQRGYRWLDQHATEFDVMHVTNAFHTAVLPAAHAQGLGLPAVIFVANHKTQLGDKKGLKGLLGLPGKRRRLVKKVSGLIAMSQAIYDELIGYGVPEEKIARIPMGVNSQVFYPVKSETERRRLREELGWLDLPTLIFVGGIVRRKRPGLLVEAVGELKKRGMDCQLVIVGPDQDAEYTKMMRERATELNISRQVNWFGFTRDIAPLFRAADYFALPSANEGMAAALIEAMSSGLPAIVTPISGSLDVVEDGVNGRIVQPDSTMIADVLAEYVRNPDIASGQGRVAYQRAIQQYSNEHVFSAYERLFRRIMHGGSAAE